MLLKDKSLNTELDTKKHPNIYHNYPFFLMLKKIQNILSYYERLGLEQINIIKFCISSRNIVYMHSEVLSYPPYLLKWILKCVLWCFIPFFLFYIDFKRIMFTYPPT